MLQNVFSEVEEMKKVFSQFWRPVRLQDDTRSVNVRLKGRNGKKIENDKTYLLVFYEFDIEELTPELACISKDMETNPDELITHLFKKMERLENRLSLLIEEK